MIQLRVVETPTCHKRRADTKLLFSLTSLISAVTASISVITVPVMIGLGAEAHAAITTNMLALTLTSVRESVPRESRSTAI